MNEFDLLLSPQDPVAVQIELAKALKRKSNLATVAQLSGDKVLAPFGQGLSRQADDYAKQNVDQYQKKADNDQTKVYQNAQIKQMEGVLAESIRNSKQDDATARRGQDLASQSALSRALFTANSRRQPRLAEGDKKRLEALSGEIGAFKSVEDFYEKGGKLGAVEVGGVPVPGARALSNFAASFGFGTDKSKESFAAKQEFDRLYTLATRNRLFGATLSKGEKKAFDEANPSTRQTDDQIKAAMGAMKKVVKAKLKRTVEGLKYEGYDDEALKAYGFDPTELEEPSSSDQDQLTDEESEELARLKKKYGR